MQNSPCTLDEMLKLYSDAGHCDLAGLVSDFAHKTEALTFRVAEEGEPPLIVTIAFCDVSNNKTDLVVIGFATTKDVEKPSPILEKFLVDVLQNHSGKNFDIVSFTCLDPDDNVPQLLPYFDKSNPGYRPLVFILTIPSNGKKRIRLAHDAEAFKNMQNRVVR